MSAALDAASAAEAHGLGTSPRVAVIGAGLAGLACADALQRAGCSVSVFEKSRGPAGRMSTRRGEEADGRAWQCDHGAQYFTARDPAFKVELARWREAGVAAPWTPRLAVFGGAAPADEKGALRQGQGGRSGAIGGGAEKAEGIVRAEAARASSTERFVGTPGMTAPGRWLASRLALHTSTTVCRLLRHGGSKETSGRWQLQSQEHGVLPELFDAVALAVPAPQALALLDAVEVVDGVAPFDPVNAVGALGAVDAGLRKLAAAVAMRPCWALMARFDAPTGLAFDAAFVNAGPLRWIARDSAKPGRTGRTGAETWSLHASAEWSQAHVQCTPAEVTDALIAAFRALGGPAPSACTAHRWLYADSAQALHEACAWSETHRLGLCGDWLHGGRVEGAWLSGRALAQQMGGALAA